MWWFVKKIYGLPYTVATTVTNRYALLLLALPPSSSFKTQICRVWKKKKRTSSFNVVLVVSTTEYSLKN